MRNNGGGDINHFAQLARYVRDSSFRVADMRSQFRIIW